MRVQGGAVQKGATESSGATADHDAPRVVKVQDAKTQLSALLREVESGAEVTIARGDRQVARLAPLRSDLEARPFGFISYTPVSYTHLTLPTILLV